MNRRQLAEKLIKAGIDERKYLLEKYINFCDVELAKLFQQICYEVWTSEPQKVAIIAEILDEISKPADNEEIRAYFYWAKAIESLVNGKLTDCLSFLDKSENSFKHRGLIHAAATTQVSKLYALALLGRYDEAVECGRRARDVFVAERDNYSAGKIEHNIGNLFLRRDFYAEAEPYLRAAHKRFLKLGDQRQTAMLENNLAFTKSAQNQFREAEKIYKRGLSRAKKCGLTAIEADIEASMSNLYLFQGKYDPALKFLERARSKYDSLKMPHQSASLELEIADIYLELNLLPESVEFYEKTEAEFARLGMQAELARSLRNHAKALLATGEPGAAAELLDKSEDLFKAEGNLIAAASVKLAKTQYFFAGKDFENAETEVREALEIFREGESVRQALLAKWLLGEILLARGETERSRAIFLETLKLSANQSRQIEYLCLVSLGKSLPDEKFLAKAARLAETLRSALSAEEFRTAFLSDKLLPYNELVKLKIGENNFREAFLWHERARSKTLLETINSANKNLSDDKQLSDLREELNWYYSRLNRQTANRLEARRELAELKKLAEKREKDYAELLRRSQINKNTGFGEIEDLDLASLQKNLSETTLVEFAVFDRQFTAFVVTDKNLEVLRNFADPESLNAEVRQLLFQIKSARFQENLSTENRAIAFRRMLRHSQKIYDALLRPLEKHFQRRLVFAPADFLHYLPFQALYDGERFLVETREISYAPSAAILQSCLKKAFVPPKKTLLVGVADKITPLVENEIETLGGLFQEAVKLLGRKATLENLRQNIGSADVLHLACHGTFRPDNPAFSSLALFNQNLTVTDARGLNLNDKFVALSACETGLNKVVSGGEITGLTRGFLSAGATALLLSLWTVNDRATLDLMKKFYRNILSGSCLSESLQTAQIELLKENFHPYFWSPFVIVGRW